MAHPRQPPCHSPGASISYQQPSPYASGHHHHHPYASPSGQGQAHSSPSSASYPTMTSANVIARNPSYLPASQGSVGGATSETVAYAHHHRGGTGPGGAGPTAAAMQSLYQAHTEAAAAAIAAQHQHQQRISISSAPTASPTTHPGSTFHSISSVVPAGGPSAPPPPLPNINGGGIVYSQQQQQQSSQQHHQGYYDQSPTSRSRLNSTYSSGSGGGGVAGGSIASGSTMNHASGALNSAVIPANRSEGQRSWQAAAEDPSLLNSSNPARRYISSAKSARGASEYDELQDEEEEDDADDDYERTREEDDDEIDIKPNLRKRKSSSSNHQDRDASGGKRSRVHFSCTECHRRKQKCNRETPCNHCLARKVPDKCKVFQPGEDTNDVQTRIGRLEKLCESYLPAILTKLEENNKRQETLETRINSMTASTTAVVLGGNSGGAAARGSDSVGAGVMLPRLMADGRRPSLPGLKDAMGEDSRRGSISTVQNPDVPWPGQLPIPRHPASYQPQQTQHQQQYPQNGGLASLAAAIAAESDATNVEGRLDPQTGGFVGSGAVSMRIGRLLDTRQQRSGSSASSTQARSNTAENGSTAASGDGKGKSSAEGQATGEQEAETMKRKPSLANSASADAERRSTTSSTDDDATANVGVVVRSIENRAIGLEEALADYGVPANETQQILSVLPERALASKLVTHFFEDINWMRSPLPRRSLLKQIDEFWSGGAKLTTKNLNVFALLMSICALAITSIDLSDRELGVRAGGGKAGSTRGRMSIARKLNYAAHRALLASSTLAVEDLTCVMALSSSARFLFLDRRISEGYQVIGQAVKTAFALGLHRDGKKLGLSHEDTQYRRIIWTVVYYGDKTLALNLGRPTAIQDSVCDAEAPFNEDIEEEYPHPHSTAVPASLPPDVLTPTCQTYASYRHGFGKIMSRVVSIYQEVARPAHYKDVLAIDKDLELLRSSLPFYFRSKLNQKDEIVVDSSVDEAFPFIPVHRFLIEAEVNFLRIALHRPFLLRSAGTKGSRYLPSRRGCVQTAHLDLKLRNHFIEHLQTKYGADGVPKSYRVHLGTYKWFSSLLICGIVLLLEPFSPDTVPLKAHLVDYVKAANDQKAKGVATDDIREKEAGILRLFLTRFDQLQSKRAKNARKHQREDAQGNQHAKASIKNEGDTDGHASLLLALSQADTPQANEDTLATMGNADGASLNLPDAGKAGSPETTTPSINSEQQPSPMIGNTFEDAQHIFDAWHRAEMASGNSSISHPFGQGPMPFDTLGGAASNAAAMMSQGPHAAMSGGESWASDGAFQAQHQWMQDGPSGLMASMDASQLAPSSVDTSAGMTPYLQPMRPSSSDGPPAEQLTDFSAGSFPSANNTQFWQDLIRRIAP